MPGPSTQAVIFDIGGVLLDGDTPMPGAVAALARCHRANIPFLLLTNTTRRSHADLHLALQRAGLDISSAQLLTPARAAAAWLAAHHARGLLLVHPGLMADFAEVDAQPIGQSVDMAFSSASTHHPQWAVVVGDAGEFFTYHALTAAFRALMAGAALLSLSDSRYFRTLGGLSLDAGPFVRLLEAAAGVTSIALGKPGAGFFQQAIAQLGIAAAHITLVGDDLHSDVLGASAAGLQTILVQTGKYQPSDADQLPPGAMLAADVMTAVDQILTG
ncbi:MAG: TIGR01458 family HAD-type hydrolase [Halothiobacillus sp.]